MPAAAPRRALAAALTLLLPSLALVEVGAEIALGLRAPSAAEWDEAARVARELRRAEELVVVAPPWAEPHARVRLGDEAMPLAHVARPDVDRFAGAVEIGLGGARHPDTASFRIEAEETVGPFVLRRLENPAAAPVVWDASEHLRPPHATVLGEHECPFSARSRPLSGGLAGHPTLPRERYECSDGRLRGAAVTVIVDEGFQPRRCIWAAPPAEGERILRFSGVPRGRARRLVGHVGLPWLLERDRPGPDASVEVRVDGATVARTVHRDGEGWTRFEAVLDARDEGQVGTLEIGVRSPSVEPRHVCVEVTLR